MLVIGHFASINTIRSNQVNNYNINGFEEKTDSILCSKCNQTINQDEDYYVCTECRENDRIQCYKCIVASSLKDLLDKQNFTKFNRNIAIYLRKREIINRV